MLNERPSDNFHWRDKLGDLENLPGESFNREAAWGKLHERMQGNPRNKKAIWYWVAAACLLLALIIPWLFLAKKNVNILVKNNTVQKQVDPSPSHLLTNNNKDTSSIISLSSIEKNRPRFPVEKSTIISSLAKHGITQFKAIRQEKEKVAFAPREITIDATLPVDTVISIASVLQEKKKLKVIHINELGDPVVETPIATKSHEQRSLVKFINQQVNTSLPSSKATGLNLFQTKKFPSN